ncbi:MAG: hypothetical protein J0I93_02280 [Legionella sp.]|nr:hypothetical protein [Legionella sp.]
MINEDLLTPLKRKLDKVVLGIEDEDQTHDERKLEFLEIDTEEEYDVERSMN